MINKLEQKQVEQLQNHICHLQNNRSQYQLDKTRKKIQIRIIS
jgi:hypothetical protein